MHIDDHWIHHPRGRLFARAWTPAAGTGAAPILLLHDSLGCVALWRDFPAALAAATGRRVVAHDRLGFGRSDARAGVLPLDFIAEEARSFVPAVLEQLGIDRFVAFGHSVGGGMAVHCAAALDARCEALITESAQAFVEDRTVRGLLAARELFKAPEQMERLARHHGDQAAWVLEAWLGTWLSPGFASWSLMDVLPEVRCPTLAIHGADDEYGSPRHPELIARLAGGGARVELLAATGHVPHRERPAQVLAAVSGWLAARR
ncbi:alpha/beta fold hydrolase [Roseateles sp.]|uniref:alpha/beta fold hydrolase n=1 Tax=Roseateles sp. TaxID=1971397 RepID=UPI0025DD4DDB|nr:alpha/beta fold hydrolase [Roseateles sp.]MBV8037247.1 alpha/beta fold hydrolase [Roseateles sp.]